MHELFLLLSSLNTIDLFFELAESLLVLLADIDHFVLRFDFFFELFDHFE